MRTLWSGHHTLNALLLGLLQLRVSLQHILDDLLLLLCQETQVDHGRPVTPPRWLVVWVFLKVPRVCQQLTRNPSSQVLDC